jgi:hypothetical protein
MQELVFANVPVALSVDELKSALHAMVGRELPAIHLTAQVLAVLRQKKQRTPLGVEDAVPLLEERPEERVHLRLPLQPVLLFKIHEQQRAHAK